MAHNVNGATLTPIYERLNGVANYHPLDAETFGDWSMEAGDIVEVTRDGKSYSSPVHTSSITWRGRAPVMAINTTGNQKRDPVAKVARRKYSGSGASMRNDQYFISELTSEDGTLHSLIVQTTTYIMTAVDDTASDLHTQIVETAGMIESSVATAQSQMYTVIRQTSTEIFNGVYNDLSGDFATIVMTSTMIATSVNSARSSLYSTIQQTSTSIMTEVVKKNRLFVQLTDPALTVPDLHDGDVWVQSSGVRTWNQVAQKVWTAIGSLQWRQLYGSVWFVRKNGAWEKHMDEAAVVEQKVRIEQDEEHYAIVARELDSQGNTLNARINVTASEIRSEVNTSKSQVYSQISQTATNIMSTVTDTRNALTTQIEQTASQIQSTASAARSTLYSVVLQTATNIMSTVVDVQGDLSTMIEQTASEIVSTASAARSDLYTVVKQTATNVFSGVYNKVSDNFSTIEQTASAITTTVAAAKSNLFTVIEQTATGVFSGVYNKVSNNFSTIEQTASQISTRVGKGEVISSINQTAESVTINASKINLSGYVKATDLTASYIAGILVNSSVLSTNYMFTKSLEIGTGGATINGYSCALEDGIKALQITQNGNTYTLQKKHFYSSDWSTVGTFSRATTLTGAWGGTVAAGKYFKVTASPQGDECYSKQLDGMSVRDDKAWANDKKSFTQTLYVYDEDGVELYEENKSFSTTDSYNAGYDKAYGYVSMPSAGTGTSFSVDVPNSARTGATTHTFTITKGTPSASGGYAAVSYNNNAVCRIALDNWWDGGYDADHSLFIGDTNYNPQSSSISVTPGSPLELWAYFLKSDGQTYQWSSKYTISAVDRYNDGFDANHNLFLGDSNYVRAPVTIGISPGNSIELWPYFLKSDGETYQWGPKYTFSASSPSIDIPAGQIYTSDRATGTKLTTLKTRYEQAKADGDYVMFRVDAGGTTKWYYMEP